MGERVIRLMTHGAWEMISRITPGSMSPCQLMGLPGHHRQDSGSGVTRAQMMTPYILMM